MKTIDFSYFIERYNAGEMNEAERQWFQKELSGNDKLLKEVELRKNTDEVLKDRNIISLRNKLADIESRRKVAVPERNSSKKVNMKYAAIFAMFVLIGSIALFSGKKLNQDELINQYYRTYQAPTTQRSGFTATNDDFSLAMEFYDTHDYKNAAILFNKVLESNPGDMQTLLLNGVSNFEENKYPEAEKSFIRVIDDNSNLFIETAKWYLALCYVKTNEKEKAIQQLEIINNEGSLYRNEAKKIIRKLK